MGPDLAAIPMIARRAVEAELLARVYRSAAVRLGQEQALALLDVAVDEAAFEAGRAFADRSPTGGPNLPHFALVLDMWKAGGALDITDVRRDGDSLSFRVMRCG